MAASDIDRQIRERIDAFVADLSTLVRAEALDAVSRALGGEIPVPLRRGPGRPRKDATSAPAPKKAAPGKRVRRTQEQLDQTATRIVEFINRKGPSRMEDLTIGLGEAAKDIRGPLKLLLEEKTLKTKGQKRAMEYLPA